QVRERSLKAEEELERRRVREAIDDVIAEQAAGRKAVAGLEKTLGALGEQRAATLVVSMDLHVAGRECTSCGRLTQSARKCPTCRSETREVPDVVEAAVAQALRQGCRVETISEADDGAFSQVGGIGALLRF